MPVGAAALLFLSLFVPFVYFNHSDGWNQTARLAELHAIVLQGTLSIDKYHEVTGDKAVIAGHYYSEKAPAIVMLAVPAFAATAVAQRIAGIDPIHPARGASRTGQRPRARWPSSPRSAASPSSACYGSV